MSNTISTRLFDLPSRAQLALTGVYQLGRGVADYTIDTFLVKKAWAQSTLSPFMKKFALLLILPLMIVAWPSHPSTVYASAVCDGSSDDTSAINAALSSGAEQVILPAGTCLISDSILIPDNTWLSGKGSATIIKTGANPSYAAVKFDGSNNARVSDLVIDGNATTSNVRTANGVFVTSGSTNDEIYNIEVHDCADNGIESDGVNTNIHDNYVHDNYTNGIYVVGLSDGTRATGIWIQHNRVIHNSKGNTTWDGIDVDPQTANVTVENNYVEGNDIILFENQSHVANSYGHRVLNNTVIHSPENGINVLGTLSDVSITDNHIDSPTGWGIALNGHVTRYSVKDNFILGSTQHGIYVRNNNAYNPSAPSNGEINGNHVENPGSTSNAYSGIVLSNSSGDVLITNNKIVDTRGSVFMKYAIDASGGGKKVIIFGNMTQGGLSGNIHAKAGQTVANNY